MGFTCWLLGASQVGAQPTPNAPAAAAETAREKTGAADSVAASIDALARHVVETSQGKQPLVPYPVEPRPQSIAALCSDLWPLCAHACQAGDVDALAEWLKALEHAHAFIDHAGFALPPFDGGLGGTAQLDVYVCPLTAADLADLPAADLPNPDHAPLTSAGVDALTLGELPLDSATAFARIEPKALPRALPCAIEALAAAGLRAQDPAESALAIGAGAALIAHVATGAGGCDEAFEAVQLAPELGLAGPAVEAKAALLQLLVLISRRHDGGDGSFIAEAFQLARQRSPDPDALRASPSFFEALDRALRNTDESLDAMVEELSVARFLATHRGQERGGLPRLPASLGVPVVRAKALSELPQHLGEHKPLLGPLGSGYARIETPGAPTGTRLNVWMRGDLGPELAMTALRLDAHGGEVGRVSAPARRLPQSFLPIELSGDTAAVVVIVTALPRELIVLGHVEPPDGFGYRLIVDTSGP